MPPVAAADNAMLDEDSTVRINVLANDTDADALTANVVTNSLHGKLVRNADGTYTYAARAGFVGADSFSYTASDGKTVSAGTISLVVQAMQFSAALAPAGGSASVIVTSSSGAVNSATPSVRYAVVNPVSGASPSGIGTMVVDWQALNGGAANVGALMPDPGKNWLGQQLVAGKVDEKERLAETTGLRVLL